MLKFHAHDTINDIAIIETAFCFWVRYGLQQDKCENIIIAQIKFQEALNHALYEGTNNA
tara:strand:- start:259 stop:435 length:177 start_codon:yes stop_codon:yes gene_type:complete